MKSRIIFVLAIVWASLIVMSVIVAVTTSPTGDGFIRGLDRLMSVLVWQIAAFAVSCAMLFLVRRNKDDLTKTLKAVGTIPILLHGLIVLLVVGAVVYAVLSE